uniref:Deleted in lung and esophageal cancer protein 1 Ig-like domain-containing protein n=1 Tax=Globisporangium ultimum (strain ATCC 200006 / CBS 805.95 / DAOM BR144) TaxID=431595 RepID=K3W8G6_GLOUD
MVAKPAASAPAKSAAIAPVAAAVVVVPDEPPAAEEPENAAIAGLEEDNAKDGKDDDAEQKIVAVGAVGHVIKRAFHQFYSPVAPAVQPNATADQSELHDDAASPDATPRHAVDEPSVATKSPRDERNDGDGHDLENAAIPIVQPVLNPYVALGNAKKAQIRQEWQQTHDNAAALLQLLAARYDDAKKADDVIAEALSDKGLVIKAQIPMGPSNLRLDPHEIAAQFDAFADTLVHATQLVREYQDRRLEKSGNRGPLAMAQTRHGIAREPLKYLEATGSSTIRTEATLTMHQAHIASVKKQTTHLHLERDGHVALPPSTEASESVSSSATTTSSSTSNDETTSISTTTTFSNSTSRPKKQLRDAAVMGAVEKRVNLAILQRMQTKLDFLRNPRYADSTNHSNLPKKTKNSANGNDHGSKGDGQEPTSDDEDNDESAAERERMLSSCCFTVVPTNVAFTAYDIGGVYEQVVYVRNTSHVSRRLRVLPPGTLYFSIYEVVFPDPSGLIAPGMHVQIMLRFTPDSRADYKDSMVVQYESNGDGGRTSEFTILLAANRDPPELSIPLMLRAQNTLVGTSSLTRMPCKNLGGKGRFWLLTENDWTQVEASSSSAGNGLRGDPTRQLLLRAMNERELRIGAFAISPTDFELNTGDSVVIQLQYVPSCIGEQREKFVMVCDNCLVRVFQVIGRGCQVEMSITSIQDKELDASIAQMGTLDHVVFDNLLVNAKAEQRFTVSNETPIDLHFAWRIEPAVDDDEVIDMEPPPYQIAPASGMFSRTAVLEFVVAFQPTQARVHSWKATLCVLEIPMCSMPGPHQRMLLAQAFENVDKGGSIALETVDCLAVHLDGAGQLGAFSIAPRYWNFGLSAAAIGDNSTRPMEAVLLLKNVTYIARITLQNQSPARVAFEIDLANVRQQHDQTPGNPLNLASASPCFDLCVTPMRGDLDAGNGQAVVEITFTPYCVGAFSLAVPCRIPGTSTGSGASSSAKATTAFVRWLLLEGVVASGHVEMLAPEVDFGLVLVGTSTETTLSFRNPSPVAADWRLVHLEAALSFEAFSNVSTQLMPGVAGGRNRELHRSSSKDSIVSRRSSITSTGGNDTSRSSFLGFTARDILPRATVTFHPEAGTIAPGETKTVKILCFAGAFPERLRAHFCCRLAPERTFSGEILAASAAVSARAEIQAPNVYLSPSKLHLGTTYLGVTVRRTMELINVSNLEAAFKFVEPQGVSKAYTVEFSPKQGTIRSKETVPVVLMYTPRQAGRTTVLLACTVCGLTAPLGIEISTNQKGLVLSYELLPTPADMHADLTKAMLPKSPKEIALERGMATEDCDLEPETNPLSTIPRLVFGDAIPLGKRRTLHLLIRNFSGVEAVLELDAKKFAAKEPSLDSH